ncbi:uncharacterized protein LOC130757577 isoform X1 [Actinidia eriantha]|uniref:uncharacterized protein LOC130757577 isoform X1 n=1 Tax=Actinidia eriantha TaxID=165200 RepID=UPI00258CEEBC|nr:uncharacterized protein LOC130757577 isoform X1 [Actinidia eriantha]XP_057468329.1 uncharacterized protein LOC130757577 isoform X1 [Actinidia eriantha]XP_057468330.1 uncharacterized protein LOC130757577 isoform X1 [Actinidia eriantha]XP_057468331.1 uncharacterized protein LOC130757577 isoform X1 [Actinidia eriantha]XP_057468332.1 uncharacterized protein LOC130757577 isoform X1 [Actinidia eriantha]XP_057468333.1 uncharacterized protein LOC130757577 isoform X1 [Actinidia eriantha]XP_05746833
MEEVVFWVSLVQRLLQRAVDRERIWSKLTTCESIEALESVEETVIRLEDLLQELHVSSSSSGKEQLKAVCSDLERIRRLEKEADFLEASFRAKAASLQQDVLQGTQLLTIDVAAALGLLRRVIIGDELTEKVKKVLQRTLTDLAPVVPIGFIMLLPVTAAGHAAMLATLQIYVPSLIPSTYGPERLDLLRQLEKVKELETIEATPHENAEESL